MNRNGTEERNFGFCSGTEQKPNHNSELRNGTEQKRNKNYFVLQPCKGQWENVIFSDESTFVILDDRAQFARRRKNDEFLEASIVPTVKRPPL
jgi:hypothetical protein